MDVEGAGEKVPQASSDGLPSYGSVVGRVGYIRLKSSGNVDFVKNLMGCIFFGTVCSLLTLAILIAIPVTHIVIGALYKDDCAREEMIPIYLIVAGSFGVLRAVVSVAELCIKHSKGQSDEEYERPRALACVDGPVSCFLFAWFIAGNVWIFGIRNSYQSDDPTAKDYCNETLYLYSFWSTIAVYIMMAVGICVPCLLSCIACCLPSKPSV